MTEQQKQIARVRSKIGKAVIDFILNNTTFHADDLRKHVAAYCGATAPASADRILRDLRKRGAINYEVVDRANSLYRVIPVTPPTLSQGSLFSP